jgi:nicotinamide mononucleotide transporter
MTAALSDIRFWLASIFPNAIEGAAVLLGLANIVLIVRRSVWNYPFGIAMVSLYAIVFFRAKLYSDALLQVFFFVVNFYGWALWQRAAAAEGEVMVERLSAAERTRWIAGGLVATAIWGFVMHRFTDASYPWWDGGVAMFSVIAQILMSRRALENWVLWIVVDMVSIGLYLAKGLAPTAMLYVIFLVLAMWGLFDWSRVRRVGDAVPA